MEVMEEREKKRETDDVTSKRKVLVLPHNSLDKIQALILLARVMKKFF